MSTQIEAALRRARVILANMAQENESAVFNRWPINHEPLRADAKAALPDIDAALAAAAQVEECGLDHDDGHGWERMVIAMRLSTIERCAQVAETVYAPGHITSKMIAAAIRKLKDEA